jgi:transcription termination/antitermination protein NusA
MSDDQDTEPISWLFAQEVPEIAAGVVEIKAIARKAGLRAKLALLSNDPKVDPIAACVGLRACRIRKIVEQLDGERIDLLRWNDCPETLIANALQPARIERVILHPALHRAVVVVKEDQISLVEGRQGANREVAGCLCGWVIEVQAQ